MFSATLGSACAQEDDAAQLHETCRKYSTELTSRRAGLSLAGVKSSGRKGCTQPWGPRAFQKLVEFSPLCAPKSRELDTACCCSLD